MWDSPSPVGSGALQVGSVRIKSNDRMPGWCPQGTGELLGVFCVSRESCPVELTVPSSPRPQMGTPRPLGQGQ